MGGWRKEGWEGVGRGGGGQLQITCCAKNLLSFSPAAIFLCRLPTISLIANTAEECRPALVRSCRAFEARGSLQTVKGVSEENQSARLHGPRRRKDQSDGRTISDRAVGSPNTASCTHGRLWLCLAFFSATSENAKRVEFMDCVFCSTGHQFAAR